MLTSHPMFVIVGIAQAFAIFHKDIFYKDITTL